MMAACGIFLVTDGMWSYAGFVCVEVVALSSILATLTMLDAFSVLRCRVRSTTKDHIVAHHSEYEDDEDFTGKKLRNRRRGKGKDEFGADELENAGMDPNLAAMDEETRKQILLLEELA